MMDVSRIRWHLCNLLKHVCKHRLKKPAIATVARYLALILVLRQCDSDCDLRAQDDVPESRFEKVTVLFPGHTTMFVKLGWH